MCKVSVLIPIYNAARYLVECLDSLRGQTLHEMEFICINDGSTDNSLSILREYNKRDDRFRIIDKKNTGYGASMNVGLQYAGGEYIGIVESDDFIAPCMFERLYHDAIRTGADIVKSNYWEHRHGTDVFCEALHTCKYEWLHCPREDDATVFAHNLFGVLSIEGFSCWRTIFTFMKHLGHRIRMFLLRSKCLHAQKKYF